jgi:hypothetical protein
VIQGFLSKFSPGFEHLIVLSQFAYFIAILLNFFFEFCCVAHEKKLGLPWF